MELDFSRIGLNDPKETGALGGRWGRGGKAYREYKWMLFSASVHYTIFICDAVMSIN